MFAAFPQAQQFAFPGSPTRHTPMHPSPLSLHRASTSSAPTEGFASPFSPPATPNNNNHFAPSPISHEKGNNTAVITPPSMASRSKTSPTYAQRYASLSNPLNNASRSYTTSSSPSARAARRNMFLNRIKQDRDAGRLENRGEQLMMMEHLAEQRQWGETMRRKAEGIMQAYQLDGEMMDDNERGMDGADEADLHALDEYISEEQAMEMAILEMEHEYEASFGRDTNMSNHAGSSFSDDEYDEIFTDLADHMPQSQGMDMSSG